MRFFLSQGKYIVGILKKLSMTKCKSMPTPMVMDLKKMNDEDSDKIDPQLIGSLMYLLPPYTHLGDVEEIFNPLGVSLGASES
jgi:hypothetical protein